jgi:signal transduction histidine kinase/ligand-binding sensor domain-containing protein
MPPSKLSRSSRWSSPTAWLKIVALLGLGFVSFCALAQEQRLSQYAHRAWLIRDGFFNGAVMTIAQTTDGYIWVGTFSGLYRFDGSRFEPWVSPDGKKLPSNVIDALLGARDGSLWIGMRGGLAHLVDHKLFVYSDFHDDVASVLEDRSGKIWFTRSEAGGALQTPICQALPAKIRCLDESDGVTTKVCCPYGLAQDAEGALWAVTEGPLFRWKPGHSETYLPNAWARTKGVETASGVVGMPDGSVLVSVQHPGAFGGLQRLSMGRWERVKVPGFDASKVTATSAFRDGDGGIWLGTIEGIYHIHGKVFEKFGIEDGLSGDFVVAFYQDRESGIWVATAGGVDYFHPRNVTNFSKREGLASDNADAVTAGRDNAVWLNSGDTLNFLKNGHIDAIRVGRGLPGPTAIFVDSFDRLWSGIDNDLYRYDHGKFQRVHGKAGGSTHFIVGITEDSSHDIWAEVSGGSPELIRVHDLQIVEKYPEAVIPSARALAAAPNGVLWLGLRNGDLARFHDGQAEVFPSPGGPKSYVYQVVVNPDGTVFATTSAGLIGWKDGTSRLLSSKNGLPCDSVIGAARDNQDALWLDTGCGLARIGKEDMSRWWRDDTVVLAPRILDASDGVVSGGFANFNPMARTPDGRLWMANASALEVIDPSHLDTNDVLPPVHIQRVVADRKPYQPNDKLSFPALMRDLEIDYAALSFVNPQKVRFRYKLEGRDKDWQEAGTRRQAFYTDLPPGTYRFHVIASNNDGIWNETGAQLGFTIPPTFTQGRWFKAICFLSFVGLVYAAYRLRVRQVIGQLRGRMYERLAERERIARDLHDTFFQGIQGLLLRFQTATSQLQRDEPSRRIFEETLKQSDQVMLEGRELVLDLRATVSQYNDLPTALADFGEGMQEGMLCDFKVAVNGTIRPLHPVVFEEIFKIGKEALGNAFWHSEAHSIETELHYEGSELRIRIRDDGKGIDPTILRRGHRDGHFGLPGMRERARKVGAHFDVWSRPGAGTEIELRIAGSIAYVSEPNRSLLWRLRCLWPSPRMGLTRIEMLPLKPSRDARG